MTTQAIQTKRYDGKQDDIGDKYDNDAESDAVQVDLTATTVLPPMKRETVDQQNPVSSNRRY
jgi:hypothetical protein